MFSTLRRLRNRTLHMRKGLQSAHPTAYIHQTANVSRDLVAKEYVFVAPGCQVDPGVSIERYSMLASHVAIVGDDHVWHTSGIPTQFAGRPAQTRTIIEADVWVGYRAVIRRGVTIGRGAIIAANAVVTRDVAPYSLVAGVPARVIGERFPDPEDRRSHDLMLEGPLLQPRFADALGADRG